jgi:uncharacterized protein YpuA (DUF1002 family)
MSVFKWFKNKMTRNVVEEIPKIFTGENDPRKNFVKPESSDPNSNQTDYMFRQIYNTIASLESLASDEETVISELSKLKLVFKNFNSNFNSKNIEIGKINNFLNVTIVNNKFYGFHKNHINIIRSKFNALMKILN